MVEVGRLGEGSAHAFFDHLYDFHRTFVDVVGRGDFEGVADLERGAGLEVAAVAFDLAGRAVMRGLAAGFVEAHGPEPFIDAHLSYRVEE